MSADPIHDAYEHVEAQLKRLARFERVAAECLHRTRVVISALEHGRDAVAIDLLEAQRKELLALVSEDPAEVRR